MENTHIMHHLYQGPDNISIERLTAKDLYEIQRALNIAELFIPTQECIILKGKIQFFLDIHDYYKF